jgi:PAS domain S-box-containing protein
MDAKLDVGDTDAQRLQLGVDCLARLVALRPTWAGTSPSHMSCTLIDTLFGELRLDLVYIRLDRHENGGPTLEARTTLKMNVGRIDAALRKHLGKDLNQWPDLASGRVGAKNLSIAAVPLVFAGKLGVLVAASDRSDFPTKSESLILDVSANQLLLALHEGQRPQQHDPAPDFQAIIDLIPIPVAVTTPNREVEAMNQNALDYFGMTLEELKGYKSMDVIHPDDLDRVFAAQREVPPVGQAYANESRHLRDDGAYPFQVEYRARRFDGVYRWVESRGYPVRDARGRIERSYSLFIDIDERKRAEEALAASERALRLIVDSIPGMVAVFSPTGELETVNSQVLKYFGATQEALKSWAAGGFTHPEDHIREVEAFTRMIATGQPSEWETRARRFDGVYRWFQTRGFPLREVSGRIVRWYNLLVDIDDRKHAESELRRAYDSIADAQRLSRTGSFIVDPLTDNHTWSEETYRIFEFEAATKVTRQRVREAVHPDDLHILESVYARHSDGEDVTFDYRIVTASGAVKHLRGLEHLIEKVADHRIYVGAIQDVTETKVAERALDKARADLDHASRVMGLGVLAASIAHEVNQPLSGIITNATTCLGMLGDDPPDLKGALETTRRTIRDGNRASEIVTRLRTLFGKKKFAAEPVDLNEATREVVVLTLHELQRHRIAVRVQPDEDLPKVIGDHVQLQQVILNLLLNASDAMRSVDDRPRLIFIETARDGGAARLAVRDTGVGIRPDSLGKLFDAFFTTKPDGMGIGLSVSRSIVERHGGRLWATNNDGPGATFAFSIPYPCTDGDMQEATGSKGRKHNA